MQYEMDLYILIDQGIFQNQTLYQIHPIPLPQLWEAVECICQY